MKPNFEQLKNLQPDMVFTLDEAATICGVSAAGVRNWAKKGLISLSKVGCRYFVTGAELKKVVKE